MLRMLSSFSTKSPTFSIGVTSRAILHHALACLLSAVFTLVCSKIHPVTYWSLQDFAGSLKPVRLDTGELCTCATEPYKSRLLGGTGLAGFVEDFWWCAWVGNCTSARDSGQVVLSADSRAIPLVQLRPKFVPESFEGFEVNKTHPSITQKPNFNF